MSQNRWTEAQKQAIEGSGGGILVSAAAGSGGRSRWMPTACWW